MAGDVRDVVALVLAGGAARRFGSDKTRADLNGRTVLARTVTQVAEVVERVVVIGPWAPDAVEQLDDPPPHRGPSSALAFGLRATEASWVLLVGGDHPLVRPALVELLVARAVRGDADAVVPVRAGRDEPLLACYRATVGPVAGGLVDRGELSMRAVLAAVVVDRVPEEVWRSVDPDGRSFLDVDTPEDLVAARRLLS